MQDDLFVQPSHDNNDKACALATSLDAALDREIRRMLPILVTDVIQALVMVLAKQLRGVTDAGQYPPGKQEQILEALCRDIRGTFALLDDDRPGHDAPLH